MEWSDSGSATINLLMQWADKAIQEKRNAAAMDFLDQVIALKPDYAEGWNRRATLNYAIGDYRKSMEDINQVLRIEPRHFGALAGMAAILSEAGNDELTLKAWERFLEIYPANRAAQEQANTLSEKIAGSRT
jgi:tetratricopeptide (TPR) repeat protein